MNSGFKKINVVMISRLPHSALNQTFIVQNFSKNRPFINAFHSSAFTCIQRPLNTILNDSNLVKIKSTSIYNLHNYFTSATNSQVEKEKKPESAFSSLIQSSDRSSQVSTHVSPTKRGKYGFKSRVLFKMDPICFI